MAIHIRKLLPYLTSTTNYSTTPPCTDFCDPTCGDFDECYSFPAGPDSLPPLPPPLPPTTIVATPSSTSHDAFHLPPLVIVVIIVLASAFILISYYAIVIKYFSFWTRLITRRAPIQTPQSDQLEDPGHGTEDTINNVANGFDPVVDHPIWLISTVGLHQSLINSITVVRYNKEDGLIDGSDCSVCLSEFQERESLRLLPKCKHAFHIDCIDTWLRSHTNCPLCRASIVVNPGRPSMGSNEPSFGNSRRVEFTQMISSDSSDVELGSSQRGNTSNNFSLVGENRGETGDYEVDHDQNKAENDLNHVAILVRRSYSMDYRNTSASFSHQNSNSNSNSSSIPIMGSSSSRPIPPRATLVKRSYSWSERVFWSSRNQSDHNSDMSP